MYEGQQLSGLWLQDDKLLMSYHISFALKKY